MKNMCRFVGVLSSTVILAFGGNAFAAAGDKIPGKYIVVLAPQANPQAVAARHGAAVEAVYTDALHGFAGAVPEARLKHLQADPDVVLIEADVEVQAFKGDVVVTGGDSPSPTVNGETLPTGIMRSGINSRADVSAVGVAVLDTGISLNHPDLNIAGGTSFMRGGKSGNDDNGHGSHVAGTIAAKLNGAGVRGVAPNARLFAVKVLDRFGSGSLSAIISGIDWVTRNAAAKGIQVANMSLGFQGTSTSLNAALDNSIASGVTYVVAAGNSAMDAQTFSPANHPKVITVSAIADSDGRCGGLGAATGYGADDTLASFSNFGALVEIAAPGVDILSTYKDGGYAYSSGTSMASPHVAGAATLVVATNPGATPEQVKGLLVNYATPQNQTCDGVTGGGFTNDRDPYAEPLLNTSNL
jgi:subtilisin